MELKNKKILITGGSSGIGKSLIRKLSERGVTKIAVLGRRIEALKELENEFSTVEFLLLQGDVSHPDVVYGSVETIQSRWGGLDILINNAGVVSAGLLQDIPDEDIINQVNINLTGVLLLTKCCLPLLKKSSDGAIINISSGLGYVAMPFYSVYAATKAAVRQFSDAIRRELYNYPIHIMTVYPTVTDTNMMVNAQVSKMDSPDKVAQGTLDGLLNKELNIIFGGQQRVDEIDLNFNDPRAVDELAKERFEALRKRTERHRSM